MPARIELAEQQPAWIPDIDNVAEVLTKLLAQSTIADKSSLYQQYDSQVRTNTVAGPGSDAGVLRIRGTHKGLAMTTDGNGRFVYLSPEVGGQIALVEAAANIIASGAEPLAITDCLNYGDPTDPEIFWELHQSVQGMADACREFNTPVYTIPETSKLVILFTMVKKIFNLKSCHNLRQNYLSVFLLRM